MSRDLQPLLKNTLLALGLCGLNPLKTNLFTPIQKAVTLLSIAAIFVIGFLEIPLNWKGIETLSNIELTPTMFMVTSKCLFLILNQSKIESTVISLEEFWSLDKFGDEFKAKVSRYHEVGYTVLKTYFMFCVLCTLALCVAPFVTGNNKLIFPGYDFCKNSCFEEQQVWQSLALTFQMIPVAIGFDCLFASFIAYGFVGIEMVKKAFQDLLLVSTNNDDHDLLRANLKALVDQHNFALK
ncbi:PREDICTED: uncharacterized protein LOC108558193 [Nicrophorus vespilloides]|uniref:Uncharacterized protein LOC108558193 n=1 Tax=Nicrophorus vespilloides TaxID=110193 RepID=A0ABM1M7G6_NICVS|nr:PREDICTED: uncharacterized protein LOC108558193 [Nicrophorus vespilloides]